MQRMRSHGAVGPVWEALVVVLAGLDRWTRRSVGIRLLLALRERRRRLPPHVLLRLGSWYEGSL